MQDEEALEVALAAAKIEAGEVVARERGHDDDEHHLRDRQEERVAERGPDARILAADAGRALERVGDIGSQRKRQLAGLKCGAVAIASATVVAARRAISSQSRLRRSAMATRRTDQASSAGMTIARVRQRTKVEAPVRPESATVKSQR